MKFVYSLVASGDDCFTEMAAISSATLRAVMPGAEIVVLSDPRTARLRTPAAALLRSTCDGWEVAPDIDGLDPIPASRRLTLSARRRLPGRIVLLDVDTLIARPLDALARTMAPLAAVPDLAQEGAPRGGARHDETGWALPTPFFNGGLVVCRDCDEAHAVFDLAIGLFAEALAKGVTSDQLALNVAAMRLGVDVETLPHAFNAQISMKDDVAVNAAVYHLYSAQSQGDDRNVLAALVRTLKTKGRLDERRFETFIRTRNPWTEITRPRQHLALGRPWVAAALYARRLAGLTG